MATTQRLSLNALAGTETVHELNAVLQSIQDDFNERLEAITNDFEWFKTVSHNEVVELKKQIESLRQSVDC